MKTFIIARKKAIAIILQAKELIESATDLFEDYVEEELSTLHDIEVRLYAQARRIQQSIINSLARDFDEEGL